jgi:hypothetical protein
MVQGIDRMTRRIYRPYNIQLETDLRIRSRGSRALSAHSNVRQKHTADGGHYGSDERR